MSDGRPDLPDRRILGVALDAAHPGLLLAMAKGGGLLDNAIRGTPSRHNVLPSHSGQ